MTAVIDAPITEREYLAAYASGDEELAALAEELTDPFHSFQPRPDQPNLFDEQTSFYRSNSKVSVCLGGNRSGKTVTAAHKVARRVRTVPPPRPHCPYWIIGETYDLSCGVCWLEKLSTLIPPSMIAHIDWYKSKRKWPFAVMLKHPEIAGEVGWVLEFKSFEQGRERMQAAAIGGAWFNEQPPLELVDEVYARTVDYGAPIVIDFTPLKPTLDWPERYQNPQEGWKFFHLNSELNEALCAGEVQRFLASIPSDYRETRRIGLFASFKGMVYKDWNASRHVTKPFELPADCYRTRGIDFGYSCPFVCVWWARLPQTITLPDGRKALEGTWALYREYSKAETLLKDHAAAIKNAEPWSRNANDGRTLADHDAQDAAELRDQGVSSYPADKQDGSVKAGIYAMQELMLSPQPNDPSIAPRLLVFDTCKTFIREVGAYRYAESTDTKNSNEEPVKKDDHTLDASRYALLDGVRRFKPGSGNVGAFLNPNSDKPDWRGQAKGWIG